MIRDIHLRVLFIPLLGIGLPLVAGLIHWQSYPVSELLLSNLFFIGTSWCIWAGSTWMHTKLRKLFAVCDSPFQKISMICGIQSLYGACIGGISALTWLSFSRESFQWNILGKFILLCMLAVILFTLVYEILFLSRERIEDNDRVQELDLERNRAELMALSGELDPHFMLNALTTMGHLLEEDPRQAALFNEKLAQVYQYFLLNKSKPLITLDEELYFIRNYYYLLQLRFRDRLFLDIRIDQEAGGLELPPFALQLLVENAIKHNEFTQEHPLHISISIHQKHIRVGNNNRPKRSLPGSTGIGLKNLEARYRIISRQDIAIERKAESFTVLLPLMNNKNEVLC